MKVNFPRMPNCYTMEKRYNCYGEEVTRRDSIGSREAYRELQEVSSVQLMRDCILRSISKENSSSFDNLRRFGYREEVANPSQPSIEVKFLEKRCSSFSSPKSRLEKTQEEEAKLAEKTSKIEMPEKTEFKNPPLPDFEFSGSFESSWELTNKSTEKETSKELSNFTGSINDTSELKTSGKNSLKLAIRSKSDGIFEDCSTYNISCPDASPVYRNEDIFTNSLAGSYSDAASIDLETSSEINYSLTDSEFSSASQVNSPDIPDEQPSLNDTFFSHLANSETVQLPNRQSPHLSQTNRKTSYSKQQARRESTTVKEDVKKKGEDVVDVSSVRTGGRRNSKKVRRRHRKNHTEDPVVYDCPKCGVSYVIASKMPNDGVCIHCDMWTSVEPEFMKREKLLTWNTCRIC